MPSAPWASGKRCRSRSATLQSSVARQLVGSLAAAAAAGSCRGPSPSLLLHLGDSHCCIIVAVDGDAVGQAGVVLKSGRADICHLLRGKRTWKRACASVDCCWESWPLVAANRRRLFKLATPPPLLSKKPTVTPNRCAAACPVGWSLVTEATYPLCLSLPNIWDGRARRGVGGPPFRSGCSFLGGPHPPVAVGC